ncbi:MAG: class I SAM-dependent methyltransferase [Bacteroidales bacterium]|nr:class I SAM-dependent methyltransferase [Bacteroidales bacterium]
MTNQWDLRYSGEDFYYGKVPNVFFADFLSTLKVKGKLLLPAEGEGRNAVYAAKLGWKATAFDSSKIAREKALKFAEEESVSIDYKQLDITDFFADEAIYDLIALVFVHLPEPLRQSFHRELIKSLKPGGMIFMASFAKEQINNHSGGPSDLRLLYSLDLLKDDFSGLRQKKLCHEQTMLNEGRHHGVAEVLIYVGEKPA